MIADDALIPAAEAARRLGVSPRRVRALAESGTIPARRVAGSWLIERSAIDKRAKRRSNPGRRLSPRSAWAVLAVLAGNPPAVGSRAEAARARQRAEHIRAYGLAPGELASRSHVHELRAHPGVLDRLRDDDALIAAGVLAARVHAADIISQEIDAYVRAEDFERIVHHYALKPGDDPNVTLRVPVGAWPFVGLVVPASVCAADLVDDGDERSVRAGLSLLARCTA